MKIKTLMLLTCGMFLFAGCEEPAPKPVDPHTEIANRALEECGKPYIWGGVGPDGYDASGLVSYCIAGEHVRIGTVTTFYSWPHIDNPVVGDICVNQGTCEIYIGNNQMVHAPTYGQTVCIASVMADMVFVDSIQ